MCCVGLLSGCTAVRMDSGSVETPSTGAVWSTPSAEPRSISVGKEVFCNRSLNMRNITAVGFDMDYTLAQYKPETFEALAYYGTIEKLVKDLRYPEEVRAKECKFAQYTKIKYPDLLLSYQMCWF